MLMEILGRDVTLEAFIGRKTLFNVVSKDGATSERPLQIDIFGLREPYERGELSKIGWILGTDNIADPLSKPMLTTKSSLWDLLTSNRLKVGSSRWADVACE